MTKEYTIGELAKAGQVTPRTVRYYVAEQLLSAPAGGGRAATYTSEHLDRLRLIKILKDEYLPLHEIRILISGLDYEAVLELLAEKQQSESSPAPSQNSTKAYLKTLLQPPEESPETPLMRHKVKLQKQRSSPAPKKMAKREVDFAEAVPPPPTSPGAPSMPEAPYSMRLTETAVEFDTDTLEEATKTGEILQPTAATRWHRIEITPNVELHVKEGLENSSLWQKVEHLIKLARQILSSLI